MSNRSISCDQGQRWLTSKRCAVQMHLVCMDHECSQQELRGKGTWDMGPEWGDPEEVYCLTAVTHLTYHSRSGLSAEGNFVCTDLWFPVWGYSKYHLESYVEILDL